MKSFHFLKFMIISNITRTLVKCVFLRPEGILIGLKGTLANTLWELVVLCLHLCLQRSRAQMICYWQGSLQVVALCVFASILLALT
jgi:hypothetical protein